MGQCDECGTTVSMPYTCQRCDNDYCSDHRLPENHYCTNGEVIYAGSPGRISLAIGYALLPFVLLYQILRGVLGLVVRIASNPVAAISVLIVIVLAASFFGVVDIPTEAVSAGLAGALNDTTGAPGSDTDATTGPAAYSDSSGDNLPNGWATENQSPTGAPLPGLSSGGKHLYIQLWYGTNVEPYSAGEKQALEAYFDDMQVDSPVGSGIDLHIVEERRLDDPVTFGDEASMGELSGEYQTEEQMGAALCTHHLVVVGESTDPDVAGRGDSPGYFVAVDGTLTRSEANSTVRVSSTVHELLHNIVGRLDTNQSDVMDNGYHTTSGWLTGQRERSETALSQPTRQKLSESGFADVPDNLVSCMS